MSKLLTIPVDSKYATTNCETCDFSNSITLPDNSWTIEANNIDTTKVRNVLGETTNNVGKLCNSNKINKYALFQPIYGDGFRIGDFMGYNHHAKPYTYFFNPQIYKSCIKNALGVGAVGVFVERAERPPQMDDDTVSWNYIKVRIEYDSGTKGAWSSMFKAGQEIIVEVQSTTDPITYTGCTLTAHYCDVNGNTLRVIEDTHPLFELFMDVYYTSVAITQGNQIPARHYYPYYDGGNKYDLYVESSDIGYDNLTNPYKITSTVRPMTTKLNSQGWTCNYGFSIMYANNKYWMYNVFSGEQRTLGSKYKENGTWYRVDSVYGNGAVEAVVPFSVVNGYY